MSNEVIEAFCCGESRWHEVEHPNRHRDGGVVELHSIWCVLCDTRQVYQVESSIWHSGDGMVVHRTRGHWRVIQRRRYRTR